MPQKRFLGKLPPKVDRRTLYLGDYFTPLLLSPPTTSLWHKAVPHWLRAGNTLYGNCVIATPSHMIRSWRANAINDETPISDEMVIDLSREMGALNGYVILDRLRYWRKNGMWGNRISAFASISPQDDIDIRIAIYEFGAADIGLALPSAWRKDEIWDTGHGHSYRPGTWGLHSVPLLGYDQNYVYCVTWGELQPITWRALARYCDEAYTSIDEVWVTNNRTTPHGFDIETLQADLQAVTA